MSLFTCTWGHNDEQSVRMFGLGCDLHCVSLQWGDLRRGSIQVNDALSDLSAIPMEVTLAGMHGKVHEGLMAAATYIHCNTGAALQKAAADFPGWPLLITGHSMGGEHASCVSQAIGSDSYLLLLGIHHRIVREILNSPVPA